MTVLLLLQNANNSEIIGRDFQPRCPGLPLSHLSVFLALTHTPLSDHYVHKEPFNQRARTRTRTHADADTGRLANTHTNTHARTHARTHTDRYIHARVHTHTHSTPHVSSARPAYARTLKTLNIFS
jgi:hypothetical protein